jgi:hypothetical protein
MNCGNETGARLPATGRKRLTKEGPGDALIAAVTGSRHTAADWARRFLLNMDEQSKTVRLSFDRVQDQNTWGEEIASGTGEAPFDRTRKTFLAFPVLESVGLHQKCGRAQIELTNAIPAILNTPKHSFASGDLRTRHVAISASQEGPASWNPIVIVGQFQFPVGKLLLHES